jgi:2-methylcitrate dehydratase PrpD
VPAALAAGEKFGITETHFLRAVALGYDIGPRVTIALYNGPRHVSLRETGIPDYQLFQTKKR